MSSPPPDDPWRAKAKARILAGVAAGKTVRAVCEGGGMPCPQSVTNWWRADAGFAAALDAARARGDLARRGLAFEAAVAAAFLDRVANGEAVRALLARPGMPSQAAYRLWRRTNAEFEAEVWRLSRTKAAVRGQMRAAGIVGGGGRPFRAFDQAVADRILLAVMRGANLRRMLETDPSLPCRVVLYRWRAAEPVWSRALRAAMKTGRLVRGRARSLARLTPELNEEIAMRVVEGASLRSLGAEAAMPCPHTLYRWVATSPAFAQEMARAAELRENYLSDRVLAASEDSAALGLAAATRNVRALQWRVAQLSKRPGWKRAR